MRSWIANTHCRRNQTRTKPVTEQTVKSQAFQNMASTFTYIYIQTYGNGDVPFSWRGYRQQMVAQDTCSEQHDRLALQLVHFVVMRCSDMSNLGHFTQAMAMILPGNDGNRKSPICRWTSCSKLHWMEGIPSHVWWGLSFFFSHGIDMH